MTSDSAAPMSDGKSGTNLAFVGFQGCGKTTVLGHLCKLLGAFPEDEQRQCKELAKELGRPDQANNWMLDKLLLERESGSTVESSMQRFVSDTFCFTAIDTPGRPEFSKNLLSVTSLADVAVLVVSAAAGEFEADVESGRSREIALSCFTMGIKTVVTIVTKMDDMSVDYSSSRFEDIKKVVGAFLKDVGYKSKDAPFIPVSGLLGDNLTTKSVAMGWYSGTTVLESLDAIGPINRPAEKPLRLPVLKVHNVEGAGTVVVGRVETGSLRPGIKVLFSPGGQIAEARTIMKYGEDVSEAKGGDIVSFSLGEGVRPELISRGMVASPVTNDPAADADSFIAQIVVLDHPGFRAGWCPTIAIHTAQVPCEFEEIISKIDRKTGKETEMTERIKTGEVITARLRPMKPVCVEPFSAYPSLGRFAIRDHNRTVAVGVIKEVTKRAIPKPKSGNQNEYFNGDE